jgi:hypothetical protein
MLTIINYYSSPRVDSRVRMNSDYVLGLSYICWAQCSDSQGWAQTPELDFLPEEGCKKEGGVSKYGGRAEGGVPK